MRHPLLLAGVAVAALLTAACDDNGLGSRGDGSLRPPAGPALSVGPMSTVKIACPGKLQEQAYGRCFAYGVDSLGFVTGDQGGTFSTTTPGRIAMTSTGEFIATSAGTANVSVSLNGMSAALNVRIYTATDPNVDLDGPHLILPGATCTWTATAGGGTTPYTYTWTVSGPGSGTASGNTWTGGGTGNFTLTVTVSTPDGRKAIGTASVIPIAGAPAC